MNRTNVKIWAIKLTTVCLLALPPAILMSVGKPIAKSRLVKMEQSGVTKDVETFMQEHKLNRNDMGLLMNAYQYKFPNSYISQIGSIAITLILYKVISVVLCTLLIRKKDAQPAGSDYRATRSV